MMVVLLILSVLVGVVLGIFFGKEEKIAKNFLILSAGFLIAICMNELFPSIYAAHTHSIGLWVLGGVVLQMFLENFTKGFEHGHIHQPTEKNILPIGLVIGLFIHAFIEGIPLANEKDLASPYLQGILVHNVPISFILGTFLFRHKKLSSYSWFIIGLFAIASPLGYWLGGFLPVSYIPYIMAIVGGIFLHISSVIIFESNKNHNIDWKKIGFVVLGIALATLFHFVGHEH